MLHLPKNSQDINEQHNTAAGRLFFLVVDNGWTSLTHLLPTGLAVASVLVLACRLGCRLIVDKSASSKTNHITNARFEYIKRVISPDI